MSRARIQHRNGEGREASKLRRRLAFRRLVWPPALIFIVLTILTIIMAFALKALVTGNLRF